MLLEAREVEVRYGSVRAVRAVSLHLRQGEIVAVLGANGAGKSSLLRALLGMARLAGGTVSFDGVDVSKWPVSAHVRAGLVLVPEGRRIVTSLTVDENLLMGACHRRAPIWRRAATTSRPCSRAASSRCSRSAARCWRRRS
jgi:branched-chain amino acid transport system ATP-binding protein